MNPMCKHAVFCLLVCSASLCVAEPLTYQGRLTDNGVNANGSFDVVFLLFDNPSATPPFLTGDCTNDVQVIDGLFTVDVEISSFDVNSDGLWLLVGVRPSTGEFCGTTLTNYQYLYPARELTYSALSIRALYSEFADEAYSATNSSTLDFKDSAAFMEKSTYDTNGDGIINPTAIQISSLAASDGSPNPALSMDAAGAAGIGTATPASRLQIVGGSDATLSGGGYLVMGQTTGGNIIIDDNEILARNNGAASTLYLNVDGGDVQTGGLFRLRNLTGDAAPVLTSRLIPPTQGGTTEATEAILFHSNDGDSTGFGPDAITLRAPAIRLQTYEDNTVNDIDDDAGANTRLYIDPAGDVGIANISPASTLSIGTTADNVARSVSIATGDQNASLSLECDDGDASISLRSDTTNGGGENFNPYIFMSQDGGISSAIAGLVGSAGTDPGGDSFLFTQDNAMLIGTRDVMPVQFGTNSTTCMTITSGGHIQMGNTSPYTTRLSVLSGVDGAATDVNAYVGVFDNTSVTNSNGPDVLLLRTSATTPSDNVNFISFMAGAAFVGAVEGNGAGGVVYKSGGADFAESLPRLDVNEILEPGDVVGVFGGKVTRRTRGADMVLAISTAPGFLGAAPEGVDASVLENVALVGQIPVKVTGPVAVGDIIVASGRQDGTAVALPSRKLTSAQQRLVIGVAWSALAGDSPGTVLTAVGMGNHNPQLDLLARRLESLEAENAALRAELEGLGALKEEVSALIAELRGDRP